MPRGTSVTGGRAVVDALVAAGVDHAFTVPGESFMGVLDALHDEPRIRVVATRHEGGAAFMAAAYARLTQRPSVCMGTRMVGAGNMAIGIHTARQDSAPLIALAGQVTTDARHREAFQEVDLAQAFGPVAKWTVEPPSSARLGELTYRAAREAILGRPGPVVISLREDLLNEQVARTELPPIERPRPAPDPDAIARTLALLRGAERPLLLLGGGVLAAGATAACVALAEALGAPVMTILRRPDAFPNDHPLYLGMTGGWAPGCVLERLLAADVLVAVGTRLNEAATHDYQVPAATTRLVHVDVDPSSLGGHATPHVACASDARLFAEALLRAVKAEPIPSDRRARWAERTRAERAIWDRDTTPGRRGGARAGYVDQQAVVWHLRRLLAPDAIVTSDAGNFGGWPHRYLRWTIPGTFLGPTNGAMGYGIPAAIAAKLASPERTVVTFVGDGGFLMTGTELETAVRERTPLVAIVLDNEQYGTIRMQQEREHPGRRMATALGPVDFAGFARSLGALGLGVRDDADLPTAFEEALRADVPAVIHVPIDPEQLSVNVDVAATANGILTTS
ncbi:MAG TPA: thiamine pyrophosphate-dependent enzyme [Candidatus Limnocylindria bacterium]